MNNKTITTTISNRLTTLLASRGFFWAIIIFFIFEALWFVFSAAYPLAFDEDFHLGVIRVYAENLSPFLSGQPAGADAFGALARDPSYLFHYLLSFPYRLLTLLTDNEITQIIILRLLNVAMFTGGLLLFRRVLQRMGASDALTHTALALFVLIPIVPYLAATINYDNLVFLVLPWLFLLAFSLVESLRRRAIDVRTLGIFIIGCMLLALVKYAVLPILLAIVVFLLIVAGRAFRGQYARIWPAARTHYKSLSALTKTSLIIIFLISFGLFFQRYGVNLILYAHPTPSCDATISQEQCMQYGPWARNFELAKTKGDFEPNPIIYTGEWLWGMWHRSFFAVSGPGNDHATRWQLPVPSAAAVAVAIFGGIAILLRFRETFRKRPFAQMMALSIAFYLIVLWVTLYGYYVMTGQPVAINGRYLLLILLPAAAIMGHAMSLLLREYPAVKAYIATLALLLLLYGGGVFTYIIRGESAWLWQNNIVLEVNETAREFLGSFILK